MKTIGGRSLLVVLAHPDDESFPIGGTLAKYSAEGTKVVLICATRGEAGIPDMGPADASQLRERELRCAIQALGLAEIRLLGYQDGRLSEAGEEQVVDRLVNLINDVRPEVLVTFGPDGISGHPDHVAISRLTTMAFDRTDVAGALFYVSPSSALREVCGVMPPKEEGDRPHAAIRVSDHLVAKVRAMQCHASQHQPYPGNPEEEARRLACHEYFTLARPTDWADNLTDLFALVP